MDWKSVTEKAGELYAPWSVVIDVFVIILAVLLINRIVQRVLRRIIKREDPAVAVWRHALFSALAPPLRAAIWLVGLTIAANLLGNTDAERPTMLSTVFPPARNVLAILVVAWFCLRIVGRVQENLRARADAQGEPLDPTASDAIDKLVKASIVITAVLVAMQSLGFSITSLLAFGGAAGIAVGFAAQSLVANLLGGLTVFATRIFKIGEYIIIPGTELMGGVQHIGWRATRVIGFDRKPFFVPNATFNTTTVINHSRMTNRRIQEHVHLRYRDVDKVAAIVSDANRMLAEHPAIEHDFFIFRFDSYGDFALKLFVYAFTVSTDYSDYMEAKEDILLKVADIIHQHGGELAVPVSTVHIPEGLQIDVEPKSLPHAERSAPD